MKIKIIVAAIISCWPAFVLAQTKPPQPPPAKSDTVLAKQSLAPAKKDTAKILQETELESISIEAIIEKPNVDIIPKRVEPELEEVEFVERSFDRELKEVPKDMLLLEDDLDRVAKLEGIKKMLEKKKKKDDK